MMGGSLNFRIALLLLGVVGVSTQQCPDGCEQCTCIDDSMICSQYDGTDLPPCLTPSLTSLTIYNSSITELNRGDLVNGSNLKDLRITDGVLSNIHMGTFDDTRSLENLQLDDNELTGFADGLFAKLSNLTSLSVVRNKIYEKITSLMFEGLGNLTTLSLDSNLIDGVQAGGLTPLESLEVLNLAGNSLRFVDEQMGFDDLLELNTLILSDNIIEYIAEATFTMNSALERIELQNNGLAKIAHDTFSFQHLLYHLDLAGNQLAQVDEALKFASAVETLILDENQLTTIGPNSFSGMNSLKHLHLNRMDTLRDIQDGAFDALVNLESLSVAENREITTFSKDALPSLQFPLLEALMLHNNSITIFEDSLFMNLANLWRADIYGNPIICSCLADWMRKLMDEDNIIWIQEWKTGQKAATCGSPYYFKDRPVYEFSVYDLTCELANVTSKKVVQDDKSAVFEVELSRGLPITNWTLPNGRTINPIRPIVPGSVGETYTMFDDNVQVEEQLVENNVILARLTVHNPDSSSEGTYTLEATNAGGTLQVDMTLKLSGGGGLSGGEIAAIIFGVAIVIVVVAFLGCMLWYYKYRSKNYSDLQEEPVEEQTDDVHAPAPSTPKEDASLTSGQRQGYGATSNPFSDPGDLLINQADTEKV